MGWSRDGMRMAADLAERLAREPHSLIVHSGAIRTRALADMVRRRSGQPVVSDPRWLERDFGSWEGRSWTAIWRETGALMDKMMTAPATFRPGGGETGAALMRRVHAAWRDLSDREDIVVVTHGGPIAALRALLTGHPLEKMIELVPPHGAIIEVRRDGSSAPREL
jgi:broad specificity phosphatase PhoE